MTIAYSCHPGTHKATATRSRPAVQPRADVFEGKDHFELRLDMPGVLADDLNVQLDRSELTVSGTRWLGPAEEGKERPSRLYRRLFLVPDSVDPAAITAGLDKGVLTLTLGKRAEAAVRTIKIAQQ